AGRPMLEVLLGEGIRNIAVVVTRYFGGTLLGTGGLVRAYSQAVREGLAHCETGSMCYGYELQIHTDYNGIGKILHLLGQRGIEPLESVYTDSVSLRLMIPAAEEEAFSKELVEITGGKAAIEKVDSRFFVV
ncbi:MAG: YigZ family protein, partial [Roseburia sp.]|nr:YigZ family protein [Roseburia sp.]